MTLFFALFDYLVISLLYWVEQVLTNQNAAYIFVYFLLRGWKIIWTWEHGSDRKLWTGIVLCVVSKLKGKSSTATNCKWMSLFCYICVSASSDSIMISPKIFIKSWSRSVKQLYWTYLETNKGWWRESNWMGWLLVSDDVWWFEATFKINFNRDT